MLSRPLAALALALAAIAAGCGTSTRTTSSTPTHATTQPQSVSNHTSGALTRPQLIASANAICAHLNARLAATNTTVGKVQEIGRIAPQVAALERAALAELIQLTPPADLATDWQQVLTDARTIANNMVTFGEYAQANNLKGVNRLLAANQTTERRVAATSKRDGFNHCAQAI